MPPAYPKSAREVTVALRAQGIGPAEITRRLNEDQAGLGFPVPCSERTVKEWLAQHKAKHGPFTVPAAEDVDADSIAKYKARAFALICREIAYFETKHKGKLTRDQSRAIRQHFETLDSMERISERAALRRRQPKRAERASGGVERDKPKSAMDQLRDQMAGHEAAHPDVTPVPEHHLGLLGEQGNEQDGTEAKGLGGASSPEPTTTSPPALLPERPPRLQSR